MTVEDFKRLQKRMEEAQDTIDRLIEGEAKEKQWELSLKAALTGYMDDADITREEKEAVRALIVNQRKAANERLAAELGEL